MARRVHSEGVRERQNMSRNDTRHQTEPRGVDRRGRVRWCCRSCRQKALADGFDEEAYRENNQ